MSSFAFCSTDGSYLYGFGYSGGENLITRLSIDSVPPLVKPWDLTFDDKDLLMINLGVIFHKKDPNYRYIYPYIVKNKKPSKTYAILMVPSSNHHIGILYDFKTSLTRKTRGLKCEHLLDSTYCQVPISGKAKYFFVIPADFTFYPVLSSGSDISMAPLRLESCLITTEPKRCENLKSIHGEQCHFVGGICLSDRERVKQTSYIVRDAQTLQTLAGFTIPLMVFFIAILLGLFSLVDYIARQERQDEPESGDDEA